MSEIRHDFWDEIFKRDLYKSINPHILSILIQKVNNLKEDFLKIYNEFKEINNRSSATAIEQIKREDMLEKVLDNMTRTISDMQQNTVMSEETGYSKSFDTFYDKLKKEVHEKFNKINLTKQKMTNKTSKVDNKTTMCIDIKYNQFVEIMYQDEIRRVFGQLIDHGKRYFSIGVTDEKKNLIDYRVRFALKEEYFNHRLLLVNKCLQLEHNVLTAKQERENFINMNMKNEIKLWTNNLSNIYNEQTRLERDKTYLPFINKMHRQDITKIFSQLRLYRDKYNIPDEEAKIITHKYFIMQKIEKLKEALDLKEEVLDFDLHIEKEATNVETNDVETTNTSNKSKNVKSELMKNNKYLQYIAKKHQEEINRVYTELELYCISYNSYKILNIDADTNVKTNYSNIKGTNEMIKTVSNSEMSTTNIKALQVVEDKFKKWFSHMNSKLIWYCNRYDMPNDNVKTDMKPISYDKPTKIHDDENELKKENEYLAFIAMMHWEKIKEIRAFFEMHLNRFNDSIENITGCYKFMEQIMFVSHEIFVLEREVSMLNHTLSFLKYC